MIEGVKLAKTPQKPRRKADVDPRPLGRNRRIVQNDSPPENSTINVPPLMRETGR